MRLLTKEMEKDLPKYNQSPQHRDLGEILFKYKFFCPWNNWKWYPIEYEDGVFFGLVDGDFVELGSFSLEELESVEIPVGITVKSGGIEFNTLKIERDLNFKPTKYKDLETTGQGGYKTYR